MAPIKTLFISATTAALMIALASALVHGDAPAPAAMPSLVPADYKGTPYKDEKVTGGPQKIPGVLMCAYYDLGGEGVAYHDNTRENSGSGKLNPPNGTYLNQFRMKEGVDTSYTKFAPNNAGPDNSLYNVAPPPAEGTLYVGWTEPGEWFNLTVEVAAAGKYAVDLHYTCNHGGEIAFDLNGKPIGSPVNIPSTADPKDPIAWRQWHHWNMLKECAVLDLPRGISVLTVHITKEGNMNLCTLEFKKKD